MSLEHNKTMMAEVKHEDGANVPPVKIYPDKFSDQVVVVTGFGAGIGEATASLFARQGAQVIGMDIDEQGMKRVQSLIRQSGGRAEVRICDISDERQVTEAIQWTINGYQKIDILANIAGIYPFHTLKEYPTDVFHRVIATNLNGTFFLTRAVLPYMEKAGYGRIIHTVSSTFNDPQPGLGAYIASKGGIIGLVRTAAVESGAGVTVNAIMPGLTSTNKVLSMEQADMMFGAVINTQAVKRKGHPLDVAHAICFIASPEASFFTGQIFNCSGGETYL